MVVGFGEIKQKLPKITRIPLFLSHKFIILCIAIGYIYIKYQPVLKIIYQIVNVIPLSCDGSCFLTLTKAAMCCVFVVPLIKHVMQPSFILRQLCIPGFAAG